MKASIQAILSALLILLFTYAAMSKLIDLDQFHAQLYRQPFSHLLADILLYTLPVTELVIVTLLSFLRTRQLGLWLSLALLIVFTIYISLGLLHYWKDIPCSCGGILNHMSWTAHYIFNWIFILINVSAILLHHLKHRSPTPKSAF